MLKRIDWEKEYCVALILFIVGEVLRYSFYLQLPFGSIACKGLIAISCGMAVLKLMVDFFYRRISKKKLLLIGIPAICCVYLVYCGKPGVFMFLLLFSAAGHNVSWYRITKCFSITLFSSVLFIMLSNYAGLVEESAIEQLRSDGIKKRFSCGFDYYYSASHYLFFATIMWLYTCRGKIRVWELGTLLILTIYVYIKADTKMPFYLSLLALGICLIMKFCSYLRNYHRIYGLAAIGIYPIAAITIFIISTKIDPVSKIWLWLDGRVNGRLTYNLWAYQNYGVKLFGNNIIWRTGEWHNLVDSSYLMYLYEYGIVFVAAVLFVCVTLGIYCHKKKDSYYAVLTCIVAVYAMFDNWLLRPECNLFIFAFPYINTVICEMKLQNKELFECARSD